MDVITTITIRTHTCDGSSVCCYFKHRISLLPENPKYDRVTAYYASMPGGLQDMIVFGIEAGGNPRTLSLIHATRSLVLITLAPIILTQFFGLRLDKPLGSPITELPLVENVGLFLTGIAGMILFKKMKLFGADILGPLMLAAPLTMSGFLTHRPSEEMIVLSQFFIGLGVGIHYQGITAKELGRDISPASALSGSLYHRHCGLHDRGSVQ